MTKDEYRIWSKADYFWQFSASFGLVIAGLVIFINALLYRRWTDEVHGLSYSEYVIGFTQYFILLIAIPTAVLLLTWLSMIRSGTFSAGWIILWLIPMLGLAIKGYVIGWLIEYMSRDCYVYYPMLLWQSWVAWKAYKLRIPESKGITNPEYPDSNR